ncbi:MAG: hypothetical protein JO213_09340 [Alphaproteobacteria bacterium]|nr:hypothetical protein [Alphaproteobacteria bacterium]MBV9585073.1 hypothetical protein [Alphaproteobacteria bacterium]
MSGRTDHHQGTLLVLVIRDAQIDMLGGHALAAFESEMVAHLTEFSPPLAKAAGEPQLRQAIRFGIGHAAEHRFDQRGPVRLYLELMLLFGSYFDTDPQYPWVAEILSSAAAQPQMQRAMLLYEKTLDYRQHVAGADDVYTLHALRNVQALARLAEPFSGSPIDGMLQEIGKLYPQKAAYVGREPLETLIREALERGRVLGFSTRRHAALLVILALAFGHGFASDPLYPWIARTLDDQTITDPTARADRLTRRALTWLDRVLANYEEAPPA